jgi:hypothetical protein
MNKLNQEIRKTCIRKWHLQQLLKVLRKNIVSKIWLQAGWENKDNYYAQHPFVAMLEIQWHTLKIDIYITHFSDISYIFGSENSPDINQNTSSFNYMLSNVYCVAIHFQYFIWSIYILSKQNLIVHQGVNPILYSMSVIGKGHVKHIQDITRYNNALKAVWMWPPKLCFVSKFCTLQNRFLSTV